MNAGPLRLSYHVPFYVGLGAIFWLIAALFIRFAGEPLFSAGSPWLLPLFAVSVPLGWVFIRACLWLGSLSTAHALLPVSLASLTGLLLDGVAISQFASLYGSSPEHVMLGAAWLLWAVGSLLSIALIMQLRSAA